MSLFHSCASDYWHILLELTFFFDFLHFWATLYNSSAMQNFQTSSSTLSDQKLDTDESFDSLITTFWRNTFIEIQITIDDHLKLTLTHLLPENEIFHELSKNNFSYFKKLPQNYCFSSFVFVNPGPACSGRYFHWRKNNQIQFSIAIIIFSYISLANERIKVIVTWKLSFR